MEVFSYTTIDRPAEGLYREKGSKFLAFAYPVTSEDEIRTRLGQLRKEFFDARHHCYAWVLGPEKKFFRAVDDGEPNHSAGDPILGQIRSRDITDVLVVVVRYFGGVKLGVGGLVTAYKTAAADALSKTNIISVEVTIPLTVTFSYADTSEVMRVVKEFDLQISAQDFSEGCRLDLQVPLRKKVAVVDRLTLLKAKGLSVLIALKK